jgi:glycosyltransferase 2 family protein
VLKRWRIGLLGLAVSLLAVYFIVSEIDLALLGDALESARWEYVIPCVILLLLGLVTRAFRWRLLLNGHLPINRAFHIMNIAYLVNGVLPLRIGELARIFLAGRGQTPVPALQTTGTIVVERLLDLLAVVLLVAVALTVGPVPDVLQRAGLLMGIVGFSGFLVLVLLSRQRNLAHRVLAWFVGWFPVLERLNVAHWLDQFLDGLLPLARASTLFGALFWTALSWGLSVMAGYVLMLTFYAVPSLAATCLYIAAAAFAIAVPATVGSLGVYEASILIALDALGYGDPYATAVAFAVTVHFVNVMVHSVTGVVGFIAEGVTLEQLSDGVRGVGQDDQPAHMELTQTER